MSVIMTVYNVSTGLTALGGNPVTETEMDAVLADIGTVNLGTRPFNTTFGYWGNSIPVGFDISASTNIALVIDYSLTITEADTYEFEINSDDYGDLHIGTTLVAFEPSGTEVTTTIPIALAPGTYVLKMRLQQGTGTYNFYINWRKQGELSYYSLDNSFVGLSAANQGTTTESHMSVGTFIDYPHKLTIKTEVDGLIASRRVEIRNRISGAYIASKISDIGGVAEFTRLPVQHIDEPHIITCFDDRNSGYLNALVYDRVFQVTNQGFPPEN